MKSSVYGDDPLSREIVLFKKKREQADMIENIFRNIKTHYNKTEISFMKTEINQRLSPNSGIYNQAAGSAYFAGLAEDLTTKAGNSRELAQGFMIPHFKVANPQQDRPQTSLQSKEVRVAGNLQH